MYTSEGKRQGPYPYGICFLIERNDEEINKSISPMGKEGIGWYQSKRIEWWKISLLYWEDTWWNIGANQAGTWGKRILREGTESAKFKGSEVEANQSPVPFL